MEAHRRRKENGVRKKNQYTVIITAEAIGPSRLRKGNRLEVEELAGRPVSVFLDGRITAAGEVRMGRGAIHIWLTDVSTSALPAGRRK